MNYGKQISKMIETLDKDVFISEFRKNTSYDVGSSSFHLPGYGDYPDRIKFHSFKERVKGELRTIVETTCNPYLMFSKTILRRSFMEKDYEGMFGWYKGNLERILEEHRKITAFLKEHEDMDISQRGISRYLFRLGDIEIYFGRFVTAKGMLRPLKAYMGNDSIYDVIETPVSKGIAGLFKEAVKKIGRKYFMELPSSLRDMIVLEEKP